MISAVCLHGQHGVCDKRVLMNTREVWRYETRYIAECVCECHEGGE